jgi:hypothetical protein
VPITTPLRPHARIVGEDRAQLAEDLKKKHKKGASIRALAKETGRSYGSINRLLREAGVTFERPQPAQRRRKTPRTLLPLPELPKGKFFLVGEELQHVTAAIRAALKTGEPPTSIAKRMGREHAWLADLLAAADKREHPERFHGERRPATARNVATAHHRGAPISSLASLWGCDEQTIIDLIAEAKTSSPNSYSAGPSEQWRREHLPPHLRPQDYKTPPSSEEWSFICDYLTKRRTEGASYQVLARETGLNHTLIWRRLRAAATS